MEEKVLFSQKEEIVIKGVEKNVILEYYLLENEKAGGKYGLKIVKKEILPNGNEEIKESYIRNDIKSEYDKMGDFVKMLARNKVTPVTADSIFEDMGM